METLLSRIAAQTVRASGRITFSDDRGEVCASACRAAAHRDRIATAAHRARL
ncbi:hypothetical protein [Actinomadura mexicana]|uniref:Uncharacterized protein n=1 Tax=Actinomadura mexicana TaxID=134959 RepID=A0A239H556_9ACTN|nr:hypothetical protein [Actinomadura mexicana]SNS76586.1 hypothetical protein SAMN06265355_12855 [Actinomadura mexicana]